ncbi:MAG: Two-component system sensor histidine kinase [uncultured Nocardioides sp.]|uniref:histidine kinase n=1 Tax=uncultured Nocardioides sp. TaxID=198441 RepID=A0A6J4NRM8_9ACTN|nr:MAG: Two-component system sensor histidine kinase [uncultured Nocardioides sp.]
MTGRVAEQSYDVGAWAALTRRLSPYLDLAIGLVAAGMSVMSLLGADVAAIDSRLEPADPLSVAASLVAGLSLVWRRSRPAASFAVFVSCCLVVTLTGHYIGLLSVLLLFSLYSLTAHSRRRDGVVGLAVCLLAFIGLAVLDVPDLGTSDVLQACALLVTAWALGDAIRSRRTQQSERLRIAEQEAAAAREQAARAVVEERLRIARELHDVIAHSMSLIAVQAGVGGHVIRSDVVAAERALEIIAETSRKALTQTRWMLGLLRGEDAGDAASPIHRIDDLAGLVRGVREAGIDVAVTIAGPARTLDAAIELTAYRIVQESLTNVLKHSLATQAQVLVTYLPDGVDVEVRDVGGGRPAAAAQVGSGSGHGLLGLRERARLLGGVLEYGALDGTGFRVAAHLPSSMEAAS